MATPIDEADAFDGAAHWGDLMARGQAGDSTAYHDLLQAIVPYVRAIARRYLGSAGELDDAVQEVLIVLHGIRHTYEPTRPFKPWLGTIAARRCIDIGRQRSRRARREVLDEDSVAGMPDSGDGPERALERRQQAHGVQAAVARLAPKMRVAVRRVYFDELTHEEAAHGTPQSAGSIKVACHRALGKLKAAIGAQDSRHD